jgi:hypothetical protein
MGSRINAISAASNGTTAMVEPEKASVRNTTGLIGSTRSRAVAR